MCCMLLIVDILVVDDVGAAVDAGSDEEKVGALLCVTCACCSGCC